MFKSGKSWYSDFIYQGRKVHESLGRNQQDSCRIATRYQHPGTDHKLSAVKILDQVPSILQRAMSSL